MERGVIMPELPEVETIVRGLRKVIVGQKIKEVEIQESKLIKFPDKNSFINGVTKSIINSVTRRGKYLIIKLSNQKDLILHLAMTGQLLIKNRAEEIKKHTHVIFRFETGQDLRFNNVRKFGRIYLVNTEEWDQINCLNKMGPEPLADDFTFDDFKKRFKRRTTAIKSLLLKQDFLAGLGNIYTDEALFKAGIAPTRGADTLTDAEKKKLFTSIKEVLKSGIKYCGTSVSDYVNIEGESGSFQEKLKVYQKGGEDCPHCGQEIVKEKIGGRSSHYCPDCQE